MAIKFQVDPNQEFQKELRSALKELDDLTIPFLAITRDWFKSNRAIFTLTKGPGKYEDLSEKYKPQKQKAVGFIYPILKRSGLLEKSITEAGDSNSINLIINKNTLILGTKVPYASAHQFGTKHLPVRPIIFTGGEQSATDDQFNRSGAWTKILRDHVLAMSSRVGEVKS